MRTGNRVLEQRRHDDEEGLMRPPVGTRRAPVMRRLAILAGLACIHAALSIALLLVVFGGGMSRFDTNAPTPLLERLADKALVVLTFPLLPAVARLPVSVQPHGFPAEHLVFVANSLIWAACLLAVWTRRSNRRVAKTAQGAPGG